jgi:hypothetical protein
MPSSSPLHYQTSSNNNFYSPPSPPSSDFYSSCAAASLYHPPPSQASSPAKRLKIQQDFDNNNFYPDIDPLDCPPIGYPLMPHPVARPVSLPPHINVQRASADPGSPATIASTLSTHSTPSPSPSRVTIMSDNSPHDFELYEDLHQIQESQQKLRTPRRLHSTTSNPSQAVNNIQGYPLDTYSQTPYNFYAQPRSAISYPKYPQQNYMRGHMPNFSGLPMAESQMISQSHHSDEDEPPALSPCNHRSQSSRPSVSEPDMMSPATPIRSPEVKEEGTSSTVQSISREEAYDFIDSWLNDYLRRTDNSTIPKLARTVSDAEQDELFNPGIAPGISHSQIGQPTDGRPSNLPSLFQQAQNQHAMARNSANQPLSRDRSPFRADSPFHPGRGQDGQPSPRATSYLPSAFPTARKQRETDMEMEAQALRNQMQKECDEIDEHPKTISPKDAYIEYHASEDGVKGSLFASQEDAYSQNDNSDGSSGGSYHGSIHDGEDQHTEQSFGLKTEESFGSMATSRRDSDVNMDYGMQMYPSNTAQHYGHHLDVPSSYYSGSSQDGSDLASQSSAMDEDYHPLSSPTMKPGDSRANSGAYSCTIHGCNQRFSTPSKMSKHRREAHRHSTPMSRDATVKSQHQGPHKCTRINPTTNKPCNTIFSRPYDLTRHEDTIHNTARQKVRCEICNDEKTFSRQDALTRHKKVKHGIDK